MSKQISDIAPPPPYYQDDEITLKDLILKIQEFGRELWHNKLWIILGVLLLAGLFVIRAKFTDTKYTASLSFMVGENGSSEQGLATSPYGTVDFGRIENNKITELARSGRIIHDVLLTKVSVNNRQDFLANHLIDIYKLHEKWEEEPLVEQYRELNLKDFYFTEDNIQALSQKGLRALSIIHELVAGNNLIGEKGIMTISYNDDTDIFKLSVASLNEMVSMRLIETIFDELKEFYIQETIGRPQKTYNLLTLQVDSLQNVLSGAERQVAYANDRNRGFTTSTASLNIGKLEREASRIELEYNTAYKQMKNLEILLTNDTPDFQIIDRTFFPIKDAPSLLKAILIGGFLGGFLSSGYVISRKIIRDALAEDNLP